MLVFDLDLFFHNRETILCSSPAPRPHYCKYPQQSVALNVIWVSQVKLMLLFGDLIWVEFMTYQKYIFQTDQLFLFHDLSQ